jgi:hypothetical protein
MICSAHFKLDAELSESFKSAAWPIMSTIMAGRNTGPVPPIFGLWFLKFVCKPHQIHGYGSLWTATHSKLGITFGFYGTKLVFASASLPRVLFGSNAQHLHNQAALDASIEALLIILDEVADIRPVVQHAKFTRLDLVRALPVPLADVKRTLRYARHPGFRGEGIMRDNSLLFDGTNIAVFFYDKEQKENLPGAGTNTRCEVRLKNAKAIARYPGLVGPGLSINFAAAYTAYREEIGKFPSIAGVPKQNIYTFLATVAASDRAYAGVPLLDLYFPMVCPTAESAARTRREVAKRTPVITNTALIDLLPPPPAFPQ